MKVDLTRNDRELEKLSRRFGLRLAIALDTLAYPIKLADRAKAIGAAIGTDHAVATSFLTGQVLPGYRQLLALCDVLDRQPGYFFDKYPGDIPPGTTIARPLGAGEDLVIRLPSEEVSSRNARRGLVYYRAKMPMGFGIQGGEYLIAFKPGRSVVTEPKKLYLFSSDEGLEVRRCVEVGIGRAAFHSDASDDVPLIVSTAPHGTQHKNFSQIVARILCGTRLHGPALRC
jgi:hypothetical protein